MVGSEFAHRIHPLDFEAREARIYDEIARGNVPGWLRRLERVELADEVDGRSRRVTFWVTPDYLSVGSDDDEFLVPLSPETARRVADLVGASLPTPRMVDAIWLAARARVTPIRLHLDEYIFTVEYFRRHHNLVRAQQRLQRIRPGTFIAGHKVDLVVPAAGLGAEAVANGEAAAEPGEVATVALYGWHRSDGTPIQSVYFVPDDSKPHFSIGVRLVDRRILVDGEERDLSDALRDPVLRRLLTDR